MKAFTLLTITALLLTGCAQNKPEAETGPPSLPEINFDLSEIDSDQNQEETKDQNQATTTESTAVQSNEIQKEEQSESTQNLSQSYEINTSTSLVEFLGEKIVGASHPGSFNLQSGKISIANNKIQSGDFIIDINSLKSYQQISALEKHLLSDDFFDAQNFPTASFKTSNIEYKSPTELEITGSLTMKGKTNSETLLATQDLDKKTITANLNLDRTKYDIIFGSGKFLKELADTAIKDIIPLEITLKY